MTRMAEAGTPSGREAAEELFTSHIAELEAGGEEWLEEFCREHAEHAVALRELYEEWRSVDDLLAQADLLTLHTPLTSETRGMVNAEFLGKVGQLRLWLT